MLNGGGRRSRAFLKSRDSVAKGARRPSSPSTRLCRLPVLRCRRFKLIFSAKATPMLRVAALLWASIAMQGVAIAEDAKQETVEVHGKSLPLSCAEWKRNQDGSWTNISPLLVGTDTLTSVTLRGAKETKGLEAKCGDASSPPATPSPSSDPTQHTRRTHHPAAPGEGT
jgi:hypothetical protein